MSITDYQNLVPYQWLAADAEGHVAEFDNAGIGELPRQLKNDKKKYMDLDGVWRHLLESLPPICDYTEIEYQKLVESNRYYRTLKENLGKSDADHSISSTGLFAFESMYTWDKDHGTYVIYSIPRSPIKISDLELTVRESILKYCKPGISFLEKKVFSAAEIVECFNLAGC